MRILVLSNFYPPYVIGGYEALCQETVESLQSAGHTVRVLTSTYGLAGAAVEEHVYRLLSLESDLDRFDPQRTLSYRRINQQNEAHLRQLLADLRPELLFVWGMWNLSQSLLAAAERLAQPPVVYYLASPWPVEPSSLAAYWDSPARPGPRRWLKQAAAHIARAARPEAWAPAPLRFEHAICNTVTLRDELVAAGRPLQRAAIICEGIDLTPYRAMGPRARAAGDALNLVYIGRLGWHKGPHTIIEAMAELVNRRVRQNICLTICGGGSPDYKQYLRELVAAHALESWVRFQKPIPRADLAAFLAQFDAVVLSSMWPEALARIMQEGMAAARVLIGTTTGASAEFLFHGETALTFPAGDARTLADRIETLADNPALGLQLARAGQELAFQRFDSQRMQSQIRDYLQCVSSS